MKLIDAYKDIKRPSLGRIDEAGLSRLLSRVSGRDFAIVTGFRGEYSMAQNRDRNGQIYNLLNSKHMGGYPLIGHWQEAPEGQEWSETDPTQLTDVTEESILFVRNDEMTQPEFVKFATALGKRFNQDAVIISLNNETVGEGVKRINEAVYLYFKDGSRDKIGDELVLGKIAQAYSQMRAKPEVPFVFEGTLAPFNVTSRMVFRSKHMLY